MGRHHQEAGEQGGFTAKAWAGPKTLVCGISNQTKPAQAVDAETRLVVAGW